MSEQTVEKIANDEKEKKPRGTGKGKMGVIVAAAIAALALVVVMAAMFIPKKPTVTATSLLKEIKEANTLSTAEYTYNSIAVAKEKETVKYHVRYKGVVKSGFDFEQIKVSEDKNGMVVTVPAIGITSVAVDEKSLDYIFTKKKYNTEETLKEALALCNEDLTAKAQNNQSLKNMAVESALEAVEAWVKPFEKQLDEGKTIRVEYAAEEKGA